MKNGGPRRNMDKIDEKRKKIIYDFICDDLYVPMKFKEIAMMLQVSKEQRGQLREILEELEKEGKIYLSKRGKYCKGAAKTLAGIYRASRKGYGFVTVSDEEPDVYIHEEHTGGAFDGDEVEVLITAQPEGRNREGKVVRILSRGHTKVVGLFQKNEKKTYGFVIPDDPKFSRDIFIPEGKAGGAASGHKVVTELVS